MGRSNVISSIFAGPSWSQHLAKQIAIAPSSTDCAPEHFCALAIRFVDAVHTGCLVHEAKMSPDAAHGRSFSHSQLLVMAVSSEYPLFLAV